MFDVINQAFNDEVLFHFPVTKGWLKKFVTSLVFYARSFFPKHTGDSSKRKCTFSYIPPDGENLDKLSFTFVSCVKSGRESTEHLMKYSEADKQWQVELELPATTHGFFMITSGTEKNKKFLEDVSVAFTKGQPQPFIYPELPIEKRGTLKTISI